MTSDPRAVLFDPGVGVLTSCPASAEPRSAVLSLCIPGRRAQYCGKQRPQPL